MRKFHQVLGLIMLLPFIAWAVTGVFFFFKPGYKEAYQPLHIKQYAIDEAIQFPEGNWLEVKVMKTVLGQHVLLKNNKGWQHYISSELTPIDQPSEEQVRAIVNDAIADNIARYGEISLIDKLQVSTSTDVRVSFNWQQMTLRQQGADTDFINTLYNIHYLRWTGNKTLDQYLGVIGLFFVVVLAGVGTWMTFTKKKVNRELF